MSGGALTAPIPPALVTVGDYDEANVLTVAWTGILATKPPRTYVSIRPSRYSYGILKEKGEFVINLPTVDIAREVDYAGIYTGKKVDKFKKCGFTKIKSDKVSAPTIGECPVAIECRVAEILQMGTHDVFIADILGVSCDERLIDGEGKIRFERAGLLAYAHGEYYALGELVGRFGFSTDRPISKKSSDSSRGKGTGDDTAAKKTALKSKGERSASVSFEGSETSKGGKRAAVKSADKVPFYESAPRKTEKRVYKDKDKGRPHGKRVKEKADE